MTKKMVSLAVAGLALIAGAGAATAATPVLTAGIYASTGQVASNNGAAGCSGVGLTTNAPNLSVISYPGAGKLGFTLYVPAPGLLQLCTGFAAIPAGGLNGYKSSASCVVDTINGNAPAETVSFSFTAQTSNANAGVGTTTVSIPPTAPIGGGCTATINTTIVRTGK